MCLLCVNLIEDKLDSLLGSANFKNFDGVLRLNCLTKIAFLASILGKDIPVLKEELNRIIGEGVMPNLDSVQSYLFLSVISPSLKVSSDSWIKTADKVPQALKDFKLIKSRFLMTSFWQKKICLLLSLTMPINWNPCR